MARRILVVGVAPIMNRACHGNRSRPWQWFTRQPTDKRRVSLSGPRLRRDKTDGIAELSLAVKNIISRIINAFFTAQMIGVTACCRR